VVELSGPLRPPLLDVLLDQPGGRVWPVVTPPAGRSYHHGDSVCSVPALSHHGRGGSVLLRTLLPSLPPRGPFKGARQTSLHAGPASFVCPCPPCRRFTFPQCPMCVAREGVSLFSTPVASCSSGLHFLSPRVLMRVQHFPSCKTQQHLLQSYDQPAPVTQTFFSS